jgi:hypothetical protein
MGIASDPMNHDAMFKMLLKAPTVLHGFFHAFLPEVARFVDFQTIEFVDKERHTFHARKRTGDLLIKTRFQGKSTGFLIHLEHQAQRETDLGRRMLEYFLLDWQDFDLPVYPIAVLSHKTRGAGRQLPLCVDFPNKQVLRFEFDVIDLARMDAEIYLKLPNPASLALSSRMKFDPTNRVGLARDFFVRLADTPIPGKVKRLVAGFFSEYQRLSSEEALQLEHKLSKVMPDMAREKVMQLTNPFIELGIQRGIQRGRKEGRREGRQEGEIELVLRLLKRRVGVLAASQERSVRKLEISRVEALSEALFDFTSRADLARWLRTNSK